MSQILSDGIYPVPAEINKCRTSEIALRSQALTIAVSRAVRMQWFRVALSMVAARASVLSGLPDLRCAPARTAKGGSSGRLTLEDFSLDEAGLVLECPCGVAPVSTSAASAKLQARFDLATCRECPERNRCPVQADKHDGQFARFQYTPTRAENQKRRLHERSDTFREIYRWRAGIEATMSRLKHQMNLAHLRVRGMPAMRYTVNLRALGLNIRRCAAVQA